MRYHRSLISQPPKGLVSHWRFDGNVLDSVGNNDGTIYGDPQFVQGVNGQALSFDGVDDYVETITPFPKEETNEISITVRCLIDSVTGDKQTLVSHHSNSDYGYEPVFERDGKIWVRSSPDGTQF